ncbi:ABC transporter ATP-binding protein [Nocardioides sp. LHD-245]|uniref:ABC transporter ATP-binding protein n=1 Tax=Nocardioides sp. LHD-245 TaxID=3051387 RepID=UPI0027DF85A2|nr:ABC transporter ATP-binding protein [Nocardioides sp. LHD-245]
MTADLAAPTSTKLSVRNLSLSYRTNKVRHLALDGINLDLAEREFVAIVGPSGCGKSTLLKIIAGLADHTAGEIYLDGQNLGDASVPPGVGMVFQNDALLPWRSVKENVRLPLVINGVPASEQRDRVAELLTMVNLDGYADYYPRQLSGGMRKRVALARTLAYDPSLYLMDEPFGPLDAQTRVRIGGEFLKIWERVGKSVLFVTHDVEEAIALADRVVVMTAGPGKIKAEHRVPIPRPRDYEEVRFTDEFHEIRQQIWHELQSEPLPDTVKK